MPGLLNLLLLLPTYEEQEEYDANEGFLGGSDGGGSGGGTLDKRSRRTANHTVVGEADGPSRRGDDCCVTSDRFRAGSGGGTCRNS